MNRTYLLAGAALSVADLAKIAGCTPEAMASAIAASGIEPGAEALGIVRTFVQRRIAAPGPYGDAVADLLKRVDLAARSPVRLFAEDEPRDATLERLRQLLGTAVKGAAIDDDPTKPRPS